MAKALTFHITKTQKWVELTAFVSWRSLITYSKICQLSENRHAFFSLGMNDPRNRFKKETIMPEWEN